MEQPVLFISISKEELKALLKESLTEILAGASKEQVTSSPLLNAQEAAHFLNLKMATLYEKTSTKVIPHVKKGNKLYFNRKDLEQWLEEGRIKTVTEIKGRATTYAKLKQHKAA